MEAGDARVAPCGDPGARCRSARPSSARRPHRWRRAGRHLPLAGGGRLRGGRVGPLAGASLGDVLGPRRGHPPGQPAGWHAGSVQADAPPPPHRRRGAIDAADRQGRGRGGLPRAELWPRVPPVAAAAVQRRADPSAGAPGCRLRSPAGRARRPATRGPGGQGAHHRAGPFPGGVGFDQVEPHPAPHPRPRSSSSNRTSRRGPNEGRHRSPTGSSLPTRSARPT